MEIEKKYKIPDNDCAKKIWEDGYLEEIGEDASREVVHMKAAYYDTADHVLLNRDIAFRIRQEGNRTIAAMKWNGESVDGLHKREEINVPIAEGELINNPSPAIFSESSDGKEMMALVGENPLYKILDINFTRKRMRVDTGDSICEVAIDTGEIVTNEGVLPICELEIELFSGTEEDVLNIGNVLSEKYGLVPENRSKYARGLDLVLKDVNGNKK
ncbi:MAG: CYTH domain-containing protein [Anaerovoracaceae bacterium]|jgi:triphosphatase